MMLAIEDENAYFIVDQCLACDSQRGYTNVSSSKPGVGTQLSNGSGPPYFFLCTIVNFLESPEAASLFVCAFTS